MGAHVMMPGYLPSVDTDVPDVKLISLMLTLTNGPNINTDVSDVKLISCMVTLKNGPDINSD